MDEAEVCSKIVVMDHGKIIAHDTPENLKKQYTSIEIKAICFKSEMLQNELINRSVPYYTNENTIIFQTKQPAQALEILSECKDEIIDFEVKKGTLNDVFLAITGKEIRE